MASNVCRVDLESPRLLCKKDGERTVRKTILVKDGDRVTVTTDNNGTFVETSTGNRSFGDDRHDEVVEDYEGQGWVIED